MQWNGARTSGVNVRPMAVYNEMENGQAALDIVVIPIWEGHAALSRPCRQSWSPFVENVGLAFLVALAIVEIDEAETMTFVECTRRCVSLESEQGKSLRTPLFCLGKQLRAYPLSEMARH